MPFTAYIVRCNPLEYATVSNPYAVSATYRLKLSKVVRHGPGRTTHFCDIVVI